MHSVLSYSGRASGGLHAAPVLFAVGTGLALHIFLVAAGIAPVIDGLLIDTDSYMKLVRIEELLAGGGWYDSHIARSNAPFGETLHWTRLFDLLVVFGAVLLRPFMALRDAVFWSGALVSPLLHVGLILALVWAARPLVSGPAVHARAFAALLTAIQPTVLAYSMPGRADHHVLLMLLFALLFGATLRALRAGAEVPRAARRGAAAAGVLAGLGVWASVELMVAAGAAAAALGLAWILRGGPWLRINFAYAAAFAAAAGLALVVERPWADLDAIEGDRLSLMQFAAASALAAMWASLALAARRAAFFALAPRLAAAAIAAAAAGGILLWAFPHLLAGPLGAVDLRIRPIWFDKVLEIQPLWPATAQNAIDLLQALGIALVGIPFLVWTLLKERGHPEFQARLGLAIGLLAVLPVALLHRRFAPYAEILAGLALADLLRRVLLRAAGEQRVLRRVLLRVGPALLMFLAPPILASAIEHRLTDTKAAAALAATCSVKEIAEVLTAPGAEWSRRPYTILATIDFAPELLYRTPHRVIGSPYHRNAAGIYDGHAALAGSEETGRRIVEARRIDLILLCPAKDEVFFGGAQAKSSLYGRLLRGEAPEWLAPVPLPQALSSQFKLFRVSGR